MISLPIDLAPYEPDVPVINLEGMPKVRCMIRMKYLIAAPEEMVRQYLLQYLVQTAGVKKSLISVEKQILVNGLPRRTDILIYDKNGNPWLLAECKSPAITINQAVFDQAAQYNMTLNVQYFLISNGIDSYLCKLDHEHKKYDFIDSFPNTGS